MNKACLLLGVLLLLTIPTAFGSNLRPGAYKGSIVIEEKFTDLDIVVKKRIAVNARVKENGQFSLISAPTGVSHDSLNGRLLNGRVQLGNGMVTSVGGLDFEGDGFGGSDIQGTITNNSLKFSWSITNDTALYGQRVTSRTVSIRRTSN